MKFSFFLSYLLAALALPVWAQAPTAQTDPDAEKSRIAEERKAVEARYDKERAVCYQKFAVQDCINDARRKRRTEVDGLNRQEAVINDAERKRRAAAELDKLEQKKELSVEDAGKRHQAVQSQRGREQRATERAADRQAKETEAAANRRAFEDKQRTHAQEQAAAAERRTQDAAERQRYEDRLKKAEQERAELEARNAKRTKPRAAPLPTPP